MTASRYARAASFADLEGALDVVRAAGSRVTSARRLLLEALFAAEGPVAAERLARSTGGDADAADLASTYRNLELLEELGVVRHFHLGHGPGLYALAGPDEREYLVCERCGAVRRIDAAASRARCASGSGANTGSRSASVTFRSPDCAPPARVVSTRAPG